MHDGKDVSLQDNIVHHQSGGIFQPPHLSHPARSSGISDAFEVTENSDEVLEMHFLIKHIPKFSQNPPAVINS